MGTLSLHLFVYYLCLLFQIHQSDLDFLHLNQSLCISINQLMLFLYFLENYISNE